jgi:hypothetical protein
MKIAGWGSQGNIGQRGRRFAQYGKLTRLQQAQPDDHEGNRVTAS